MPPRNVQLETANATYYQFKTDLLKQEVSYSTEKNQPTNLVTLPVARVFEVISLNKQGIKPETLSGEAEGSRKEPSAFGDLLGQDSINRFDKKKKKKNKGGKDKGKDRQDKQAGKAGGGKPQGGDKPQADASPAQNQAKSGKNRQGGKPRQQGGKGRRADRRGPKQPSANSDKGNGAQSNGQKPGADKPAQPKQA